MRTETNRKEGLDILVWVCTGDWVKVIELVREARCLIHLIVVELFHHKCGDCGAV